MVDEQEDNCDDYPQEVNAYNFLKKTIIFFSSTFKQKSNWSYCCMYIRKIPL